MYNFLSFINNILAFVFSFILLFRRRFGEAGLPEHSINIKMQGSAGQSFCAFMTKGIHVTLEGDANDYVGKVSTSFLNLRHKQSIYKSFILIFILIHSNLYHNI